MVCLMKVDRLNLKAAGSSGRPSEIRREMTTVISCSQYELSKDMDENAAMVRLCEMAMLYTRDAPERHSMISGGDEGGEN